MITDLVWIWLYVQLRFLHLPHWSKSVLVP